MLAQPRSASATAKATVFVSSSGRSRADTGRADVGEVLPGGRAVERWATVVSEPIVLGPVIEDLGLRTTPHDLAARVDVDVPAGTALLRIRVRDPDGSAAERIVDVVAQRLTAVAPTLSSTGPPSRVTVLDTAGSPAPPSIPDPGPLLIGLLIGGAAAAPLLVPRRLPPHAPSGVEAPSMRLAP